MESASNRWPNVLPESSSADNRFRDAPPGGTAAGGHGCLRAIGSVFHHSSLLTIIQNFYNRHRAPSTWWGIRPSGISRRFRVTIDAERKGHSPGWFTRPARLTCQTHQRDPGRGLRRLVGESANYRLLF